MRTMKDYYNRDKTETYKILYYFFVVSVIFFAISFFYWATV